MNTYEITRKQINGMKPIAEGYKVVKYDGGTLQTFRYGNKGDNLCGRIWKVDGDIKACNWGLHFSKDPAMVFNFYEPLGYNRYFKVRAYGDIVDHENTKSVTNILEFVEEYDLVQYIKIIKGYERSETSLPAVRDSSAVHDSWGVSECNGAYMSAFCFKKNGAAFCLFNKKRTEKRCQEVLKKLRSFGWSPKFDNTYDIKGNKEWWALCFPEIMAVDNKTAWSKMPENMREYIFSLPEFNKKVWDEITK
jgi:hypothetical protein